MTAIFSPDRKHRLTLWRQWDTTKPILLVIGLNPSTADETKDDPTIRRCVRFAKDWGFGSLCMMNLFSIRATDPKEMLACENPIHEWNDTLLKTTIDGAGMILAAWGTHGSHLRRDDLIYNLMIQANRPIHCLGKTKDGQPRHPLYVKADTQPEVI